MDDYRFPKKEEEFNRLLVREYFKYGSVEGALRAHRYNIPVSYATYQRVLDKWGIVKVAGPNNKLTEAIEFFEHLAKDNLSIENLYKKTPHRFQTSIKTLYRVLTYMKEGITRRVGTALVVTPYDSKTKVLLGRDVSLPRLELGKPYGSISLPMGYSRKRDSRKINILRVLQQEIFVKRAIDKNFPHELVPVVPEPFMYLDIADVRVAVYHLQLPKELSSLRNFSSFKLNNYRFLSLDEVLSANEGFRAGVKEAVGGYKRYLHLLERKLVVNPLQAQSILNRKLATLTLDLEV